jgi:hypothetical protein
MGWFDISELDVKRIEFPENSVWRRGSSCAVTPVSSSLRSDFGILLQSLCFPKTCCTGTVDGECDGGDGISDWVTHEVVVTLSYLCNTSSIFCLDVRSVHCATQCTG